MIILQHLQRCLVVCIIEIEVVEVGNETELCVDTFAIFRMHTEVFAHVCTFPTMENKLVECLFCIIYLRRVELANAEVGSSKFNHTPCM